MNPSEAHQEAVATGSGRIQNIEYKKEKREQHEDAKAAPDENVEYLRTDRKEAKAGPRSETLASLKRLKKKG